jgi:photosystem II stability/assembly factor-like uncharacterized protein
MDTLIRNRDGCFTDIYFTDPEHGWAIGWFETLYHTSDGGETWKPLNYPDDETYSVFFIDTLTGWTAGCHATTMKTTNGGVTWSYLPSFNMFSGDLFEIWFTDSLTGFSVGYKMNGSEVKGVMIQTFDGGASWYFADLPDVESLFDIYFVDSYLGWSVGSDGEILHTDNGGQTWHSQNSGTTASLSSVFFTDPNNGWITGSDGMILHSSDGGNTWIPQESGTTFDLGACAFTDPETGWVCGGKWNSNALILHTTDGGITWNEQPSGTWDYLSKIFFFSNQEGWAIAWWKPTILHTDNGGYVGEKEPGIVPISLSLKSYPNPSARSTTLEFFLESPSQVVLLVYDLYGKIVKEEQFACNRAGKQSITLDIAGIVPGIYLISIQTSTGSQQSKVVVQ